MYFVLTLAFAVLTVILYGSLRWSFYMRRMRVHLEASRAPIWPKRYSANQICDLPAPVQRYFHSVLKEGQPIVSAVELEHTGSFSAGKSPGKWSPFTSTERVITHHPGFDWQACIAIAPGLHVHVHDAYIAREGFLDAAFFGIVPLVNQRGRNELAHGELMRFVAEAAWYPTALLPCAGVRWDAEDNHSAQVAFQDTDIVVTLLFRFNDDGLVDTVRAEARGRMVGTAVVSTPWQGRFWNYALRDGMLVPLDAEVAWILPEGEKPYWRGHITRVSYEFAQ